MAGTDIGLLRLLRGRTDETSVLNAPGRMVTGDPVQLPARLAVAALRLRATATVDDGATIDYAALAGQAAFRGYREVAAELHAYDPWTLGTREERLAFWINVFNALAIDAVISFGLHGSIREAPGFFRRAAYSIGGSRFSAETIEHGILRGNRPALAKLPAPFADGDPRLSLSIQPADARVHFALNCAARSCPPLRVYSAHQIDTELDAAAGAFMHGGVVMEAGRALVSPIFQFYQDDFGGQQGIAEWICRYTEEPSLCAAVREAFAAGRVAYDPYDWTLNAPTA